MKRFLPFVIVGLVAVATVGSGVCLYRTKVAANTPKPNVSSNSTETGKPLHTLGPANAPVTLEEFGDFQCPPCGKIAEPINELQRNYSTKLRVVFRNFPLAVHQHAREAARAAEAAGMQGKYWQMHDLLFREQAVWSKSEDAPGLFNAYAGMLGLNLEKFKKDVASPEVEQRISVDQRRGTEIGVHNTPTLFLNNEALSPELLDPVKLRGVVGQAVQQKNPSS